MAGIRGIARRLSLAFVEGDELHSPRSVSKMKAGIALRDEDRWPWLDRIAARLADREAAPAGLVITCSALKRSYRDRIRLTAPGVRFHSFIAGRGYLRGDHGEIARAMIDLHQSAINRFA